VADASAPLSTLAERFDPSAFDAPAGRARIRLIVTGGDSWDAVVDDKRARLEKPGRRGPDAELEADAATWRRIAADVRGGMDAFRAGRLKVRRNMHLGVGFLAATAERGPGALRFGRVKTNLGEMALFEAGQGDPLVMLHGLGATKAEFLPTVAALAPNRRIIALDLPGFGDSDKPFPASYDARFFARWVEAALDALELPNDVHVLGHSMGGRVAIEVGLRRPDRVGGLVLMTPSMAWLVDRPWARYLRLVRPELGLLQPTPRAVVEQVVRRAVPGAGNDWVRAGLDEFMRAYLTPRGRVAFYAAARQIYLEQPDGDNGFWTRIESLRVDSLFIWGRRDGLVPIGFQRHVQRAVPAARHVEVDSGHVPQLERPGETHRAIASFLDRPRQRPVAADRPRRRARGA
jgi:pimeloyl-ACP methyl ester carboxylesterase